MAREILFRGKRIDTGKWVHGYVCRSHRHHGSLDSEIESYYFNKLDDNGWASECVVSAETVCQYTGLTDKNGRKIFEGDIVEILSDDDEINIIEWDIDTARFTIVQHGSVICDFDNYLGYELEVIGNIFDNPELVEKPKCSGCKCCNCFIKSECCPECEGPILNCEEYSEIDIYNPDRMEKGAE